jgi:hypothetical protein
MLYLNKQDFYYGAILTALIGKKYKTVLIDGDSDDKRIYQFTSDTDSDFIAYLKHCMAPTERSKSTSWQFMFSDEEINYLMEKLCNNENIKLVLLCGKRDFRYSEIAVIEKNEIESSIFEKSKDKKNITLFRGKGCESYRISRGGGRENDLIIPTSRIENTERELAVKI